LCFHFSAKEEQRHDWTTDKNNRQRRSKEKHANLYSSGNVKKISQVCVCVYMCVCAMTPSL